MTKEKQIEEMAKLICIYPHCINYNIIGGCTKNDCRTIDRAEALYNAGYRKQSEGEWIKDEKSKFEHRYHCSVCNFYLIGEPTKYCEDCGAKMKGGAE